MWGQRTGRDLVQVQPDKMTRPIQSPYEGELKPKSHTFQTTGKSQLKFCITKISTKVHAMNKSIQGFY